MEMQNCPPHPPKSQREMAAAGLPRHLNADQENAWITGYATQAVHLAADFLRYQDNQDS